MTRLEGQGASNEASLAAVSAGLPGGSRVLWGAARGDGDGFETLTKEEAVAALRGHEREGFCHTLWTFHAPFIGGLCNCDRSDCLAMRCTVTHAVPVMFRADYVAQVDPDACVGCRECMRVCQFGGIAYSASDRKAVVDARWCYGCGICRSACKKNAIRLKERKEVPVASDLW